MHTRTAMYADVMGRSPSFLSWDRFIGANCIRSLLLLLFFGFGYFRTDVNSFTQPRQERAFHLPVSPIRNLSHEARGVYHRGWPYIIYSVDAHPQQPERADHRSLLPFPFLFVLRHSLSFSKVYYVQLALN